MRLPNFRRLFSSDFKAEYKELIDTLSGTINSGVEVLYEALNNKLTFSENFAATVATFSVIVDSNGTPTGTTSIRLSNTLKVEGLLVIGVTDTTDATSYPTGAPLVSFTQSSQSLIINNVKGLIAGHSYSIKVIALN